MSNFVDDNTELDFPKSSLRITPPGQEDRTLRAEDWNRACQAMLDMRTKIQELTAVGPEGQQLTIAPTQPVPFFEGSNMPPGYIANFTQPGLADHTNLEWRGADNQSTVLTGIDATGVPEGAIRIFNNATLSPGDAGSVILLDEVDARVTAGPYESLPANRICTPSQMDYKVGKQGVCVLQRRRNKDGELRWMVLSGDARKTWLWVQGLAFYPHLQVGTVVAPVVGQQDNWNPVGVPYFGNPDNLTVDGGNVLDARTFTMWNVFTDALGASVSGFLGTELNGIMTDWGPVRCVFNSGPGPITFQHLNAGSDIWNRLVLPDERDYVLPAKCAAWFWRPYLDEGFGITVQWRMLGVSNEVFRSVQTAGRVTARQLTLTPEANVVLPAGLTSSWNPGTQAVIRVAGTAPYSMVDGLVPAGSELVGNELRIVKNVGAAPIVLRPEIGSASPIEYRFQLPASSSAPNAIPPLVIAQNQEVILQQGTPLDGGKWRVIGKDAFNAISNVGASITPAVFAAGNVNNYAPVDAVTGVPGRLAAVWRLQGAVGTVLTGIEPNPAGMPPFVHGDRLMLINYASSFLLAHQSPASALGSRIICPPGGVNNPDYTLLTNATVWLWRDGISEAWIVEGARV